MKQIILLCGLLFLTGCSQSILLTTEETIEIQLPQWPPEDSCKDKYPPLTRWLLKTGNAFSTSERFLPADTTSVTITTNRNQPFSATVLPVTQSTLPDTPETSYFSPAGFLYPYATGDSPQHNFSWNHGYLAQQMLTIISSQKETGVTSPHMNEYLSGFNWKKALETIDKKIEASNTSESAFYNPWLIDTPRLLEAICYGNFKSSFFNTTGCYSIPIEEELSSFIPENSIIKTRQQISIKKETPTLVSDCKIYGTIITVSSAKKVSKEIIYLPIFITEI